MGYDLEQIILAAEANLIMAPPGFADAVMRRLPVPVLGRKLCAAACFASAAAILLFTVTGIDRTILAFLSEQSERLGDLWDLAKNLSWGRNLQ